MDVNPCGHFNLGTYVLLRKKISCVIKCFENGACLTNHSHLYWYVLCKLRIEERSMWTSWNRSLAMLHSLHKQTETTIGRTCLAFI